MRSQCLLDVLDAFVPAHRVTADDQRVRLSDGFPVVPTRRCASGGQQPRTVVGHRRCVARQRLSLPSATREGLENETRRGRWFVGTGVDHEWL